MHMNASNCCLQLQSDRGRRRRRQSKHSPCRDEDVGLHRELDGAGLGHNDLGSDSGQGRNKTRAGTADLSCSETVPDCRACGDSNSQLALGVAAAAAATDGGWAVGVKELVGRDWVLVHARVLVVQETVAVAIAESGAVVLRDAETLARGKVGVGARVVDTEGAQIDVVAAPVPPGQVAVGVCGRGGSCSARGLDRGGKSSVGRDNLGSHNGNGDDWDRGCSRGCHDSCARHANKIGACRRSTLVRVTVTVGAISTEQKARAEARAPLMLFKALVIRLNGRHARSEIRPARASRNDRSLRSAR